MPRPAGEDLHELFASTGYPDGWEQRADQQMYFVHGVAQALKLVRKRPTRREFMPLVQDVARARVESGWENAVLASTWSSFESQNQVNRFVSIQNNTFTTAANGVLAVELLLARNGYTGDIYKEKLCFVVAQDSHITELTRPMFVELCSAILNREGRPWEEVLRKNTHQQPELFRELVSGRLVTAGLAGQILTEIKKYLPSFSGQVSNDFNERQNSLAQLRKEAYEAEKKSGQKQYRVKVTGAKAEYYEG